MRATANKSRRSHMRDWTSNPAIRHPRSVFDLSYPIKTAFSSGYLIPFKPLEILPGDTIRTRLDALIRMATPIHPVMDRITATIHFWFCPARQLWENWERFMGEKISPTDSTDFLVPIMGMQENSAIGAKTLADYMGVPIANVPSGANALTLNALPFRAYNWIWNEHYREQDLQDPVPVNKTDSADSVLDYTLLRRGKRFDYFTSAKPFQQKGDPVPLALGGSAPVRGANEANEDENRVSPTMVTTAAGADRGFMEINNAEVNDRGLNLSLASTVEDNPVAFSPQFQGLYADLGATSSVTITQLRNSIAIQHILERDARGGTRYPEQLVSRFGVSDPQLLVLQRPEFLGGGQIQVNISPVPQTQSSDGATTPQGNLAAVGTAMINGNIGYTHSFTEHGYVLPLITIQADLNYQQGLDKMWSRRERFDFYTPELAHVSEQPIFSKEIYADGSEADDSVFGYNGAYDEYRTGISLISNRFKSNPVDGQTLDAWHVTQQFNTRPQLNDSFIEDNPPMSRVLAVATEPEFIMDGYMSIKAARILPLTGIPGLYRV